MASLGNQRVSQQTSADIKAISARVSKHDCGNEGNEGSEVASKY